MLVLCQITRINNLYWFAEQWNIILYNSLSQYIRNPHQSKGYKMCVEPSDWNTHITFRLTCDQMWCTLFQSLAQCAQSATTEWPGRPIPILPLFSTTSSHWQDYLTNGWLRSHLLLVFVINDRETTVIFLNGLAEKTFNLHFVGSRLDVLTGFYIHLHVRQLHLLLIISSPPPSPWVYI